MSFFEISSLVHCHENNNVSSLFPFLCLFYMVWRHLRLFYSMNLNIFIVLQHVFGIATSLLSQIGKKGCNTMMLMRTWCFHNLVHLEMSCLWTVIQLTKKMTKTWGYTQQIVYVLMWETYQSKSLVSNFSSFSY